MTNDVVLHIGVPKSGTTYLQEVLWGNPDRLAQLGWTLAAARFEEHTRAGSDLVGRVNGSGRRAGAWDRLAARVLATPQRVVVSQEVMVRGRSVEADRAVSSLMPRPVHVVITARDPVRQVASSWQQHVKQRFTRPLAEFTDAVMNRAPLADHFWLTQDLLGVVDAWLDLLPPDRVAVVTVPASGAPPATLWERFAAACGFAAEGFDLDVSTPNASLGAAQVELLRRLNLALDERATDALRYGSLVRRLVANDLLAQQVAYTPYGIDDRTHVWAADLGRTWVEGVRARGVRVVGDLAELAPRPYEEVGDPQQVDEAEVAAAATDALVGVLMAWENRRRGLAPERGDKPRDAGARRRPDAEERVGSA